MNCAGINRLMIALALSVLATGAAMAEETHGSERSMMLEFRGGFSTPNIDAGLAGGSPYADTFGDSPMTSMGVHADYQLWQDVGSIAIGVGATYSWVSGKAQASDGSESSDDTTLNIVPLQAQLIYRFDYLAIHNNFPVVPYLKIGLTAAVWWATNGKGEIASGWSTAQKDALANDPDFDADAAEPYVARGVTFGWHAGGGIQFLLDFITPDIAQTFDYEVGVNNTYLFAEVMYNDVKDFQHKGLGLGNPDSIVLDSIGFSAGLMFEF